MLRMVPSWGVESCHFRQNGDFGNMKVTATKLANESKAVLDRVIEHGETAKVERHGKTVALIRPKVGASRDEVIDLLNNIKFTKEETKELKKAMDAASHVVGYAGRP
jgi:antitoxin (DNA-binding transcriptional repressor) of toxin-antitoxin stability system